MMCPDPTYIEIDLGFFVKDNSTTVHREGAVLRLLTVASAPASKVPSSLALRVSEKTIARPGRHPVLEQSGRTNGSRGRAGLKRKSTTHT